MRHDRATKVGRPLHPKMIAAQREYLTRTRITQEGAGRASAEDLAGAGEAWIAIPPPMDRSGNSGLGTEPDPAIANEMGVPSYVVANKRRQLGIPGTMRRWTEAQTALLGTDKDSVVARMLGMNTAAVRTKREQLGIPPFVARCAEAEKALLGTDTDPAVAELLGRSESAVVSRRHDLGIPAYR